MLRFASNVFCHVFRKEISIVLHHASVWSEITTASVQVEAIADARRSSGGLASWDLCADISTVGKRAPELAQLHAYLVRNLPAQYELTIERDCVHVEWDARRQPPGPQIEGDLPTSST